MMDIANVKDVTVIKYGLEYDGNRWITTFTTDEMKCIDECKKNGTDKEEECECEISDTERVASVKGQRRNNPNFSAGIRIAMPFTNKRARNENQAARLRNEQLLLRFKSLEQNAMVEIENAIQAADAALQRVAATEASMEYSEAALQAEEKKLENGKSTSFIVLQRQRDYTSAQSEAIRAKSDYNKALARLAQSEGFTLDKYQLRLELK
jgi:hypothetical protein